MAFHIVLPHTRQILSDGGQPLATDGPRDSMAQLAVTLSAQLHQPDATDPRPRTDGLRAKVLPTRALWALARRVQARTGPADTVFCSSEAGGFQLAALCANRRTRPRIGVFVHNVDRPRTRFALKWWRMAQRVDQFFACSTYQAEFLRRHLNLSHDRVHHIWDHTDTRFFTPGPASPGKKRPMIVSVGLEQRDYKTLAVASADLDVDVCISGFSKDAATLVRTFPETLPANMTRRFYSWPDLVQLYRDADAVVVSCQENRYAAGVQSLLEAQACGRPVIATATQGLVAYLGEGVVRVPPGDAQRMRQAIQQTLAAPATAAQRAAQGHAQVLQRHDLDSYVATIARVLRASAGG